MFGFMNILANISKTESYTNWLQIIDNLSLKLFNLAELDMNVFSEETSTDDNQT